jgi:hypothetical protein
MNSIAFIREAKQLIADIQAFQAGMSTADAQTIEVEGTNLQRRVGRLFADMQNPSLMAAENLRDVALAANIRIEQAILAKIEQGVQMHFG